VGTRVYLQNADAPVTPSAWPTGFDSATANAVTKAASLAKAATAFATVTGASGAVATTIAFGRFVLGPLAGQSISGTITGQMKGYETNAGAQCTSVLSVRLLQPDGTERSVLLAPSYSDQVDNTATELYTSTRNMSFYDISESASISLTTRTATEGDYLEVAVGVRKNASSTSRTIGFEYGDNHATDLPVDRSTTTSYAPWVEFSGTVKLAKYATDSPSVTVSGPAFGVGTASKAESLKTQVTEVSVPAALLILKESDLVGVSETVFPRAVLVERESDGVRVGEVAVLVATTVEQLMVVTGSFPVNAQESAVGVGTASKVDTLAVGLGSVAFGVGTGSQEDAGAVRISDDTGGAILVEVVVLE
jgi:hypothetical protein